MEQTTGYQVDRVDQQDANGAQPARRRFLSGAEILARPDGRVEEVEVPEWNTWVRIRALNGGERDNYLDSLFKMQGNKRVSNTRNATARLVALCAVDEDGTLLWTEGEVGQLGKKDAAPLQRLATVAQRLAGMMDDDIEEIRKNSPSGQSDDSGST